MTPTRAIVILGLTFALSLLLSVALGGLNEKGIWPVDPQIIGTLDFGSKTSLGSFLTLLTQAIRRRSDHNGYDS